jgi:hypothetical protein
MEQIGKPMDGQQSSTPSESSQIGYNSLLEWLKRLKRLLQQKDNNLAGVQSIALAEFDWPVSLEEDHMYHSEHESTIARHQDLFKELIHNGFQSLKVLKLVFSKYYDLKTHDKRYRRFQAADKEKIKKEIRGLFEEEKLSNPTCSVLEIIFYDCFAEGVDGAPNCRNWINEPKAKSAHVFGFFLHSEIFSLSELA